MIQPIDPEEIRKLIEAHGKEETLCICDEELHELGKAISKMRRIRAWDEEYQRRREHLIEEIADVLICIEMLMKLYYISASETEDMLDRKMIRNLERIVN